MDVTRITYRRMSALNGQSVDQELIVELPRGFEIDDPELARFLFIIRKSMDAESPMV